MGQIFPFNQENFMKTWTYRDEQPDPERKAVIDSGACSAFSALFAKLFQIGKAENVNDTQFVNGVTEFFRRHTEDVVKCQKLGKEVHASSGKGYEFLLNLVGLQP